LRAGLKLALSIAALTIALSALLIGCVWAAPGEFELLYAEWRSITGGPVAPGDEAVLTAYLVFKPPGRTDVAYDVVAKLELPEPFKTASGSSTAYCWLRSMRLGDVQGLSFHFNVPSDAELRSYSFRLSVNYRYVVTEGTMGEYREQAFTFTLPLRERPRLAVEAVDDHLARGASQRLRLRLSYGGPSSAVVTSLTASSRQASVKSIEPQPPFRLDPGGGAEVYVWLYVPRGSSSVDLSMSVEYLVEGRALSATSTLSLPALDVAKPLRVEADGYGLRPGTVNDLRLRLVNTAGSSAKQVHLALSCQGLSLIGPSELTIDEVPSSGEVAVTVMAKPFRQAQQYVVSIELSYTVDGLAYEDEASLYFTELTRPQLSFTSLQASRGEGRFYVRGQVINVGSGEARYVNVTARSEELTLERSSTYIGTLEPGEAASFLITGGAAKEGVFRVALTASYADEAGAWYSESKEVEVAVERPAPTGAAGAGVAPSSLIIPLAMLSTGLFASGLLIGRYLGWRREAQRPS